MDDARMVTKSLEPNHVDAKKCKKSAKELGAMRYRGYAGDLGRDTRWRSRIRRRKSARSWARSTRLKMPTKWPVIGHLHLLFSGSAASLHAKLTVLADCYSSVMHLSLGSKSTVFVSDASTTKECFTTNLPALTFPWENSWAFIPPACHGLPTANYGKSFTRVACSNCWDRTDYKPLRIQEMKKLATAYGNDTSFVRSKKKGELRLKC